MNNIWIKSQDGRRVGQYTEIAVFQARRMHDGVTTDWNIIGSAPGADDYVVLGSYYCEEEACVVFKRIIEFIEYRSSSTFVEGSPIFALPAANSLLRDST